MSDSSQQDRPGTTATEPVVDSATASGTPATPSQRVGAEPAARASGAGEFRTGSEVGHGYVDGVTIGEKPVTFTRVDGQALFEGDIVLDGRLSEITEPGQQPPAALRPEVTLETDDDGTIQSAVVITGSQFRWANGIVPFEIDGGLPAAQ